MTRQMKDSGVEWIGEIPENWECVKLKYFYDFEKGKNAAQYTQEYIGLHSGNYPVYSGQTENNGIMGEIDTFDYDIEECLFTTTVGAKVMTPRILCGKFNLSQNCLIMKQIKECNNNFFYYILLSLFDYEKSLIPAYMQPSLRMEDLRKYAFFIPEKYEQDEIANFLDEKVGEIDSVIIKTKETIEDYKRYKQAIINKIIENEKGSKYKFRYLGELKNGLNYHSTVEKESIKFLGVGNFKDFMILNKRESFSDLPLDMELPSEYLLKNGDIIFVRSNGSKDLVGRSIMVDNVDYNLTYSGFCIRFRNKQIELVGNKYLLYFFRSEFFKQLLYIGSNGMAINNLSQDILNSVKIPIPSVKRQEEIVAYLDEKCSEIDKLIAKKEELLVDLENYKKSLIYEYVTGKKEV